MVDVIFFVVYLVVLSSVGDLVIVVDLVKLVIEKKGVVGRRRVGGEGRLYLIPIVGECGGKKLFLVGNKIGLKMDEWLS